MFELVCRLRVPVTRDEARERGEDGCKQGAMGQKEDRGKGGSEEAEGDVGQRCLKYGLSHHLNLSRCLAKFFERERERK